jgi:hypothetical protein
VLASSFTSEDPLAWRIAGEFGNSGVWTPRAGGALLVLSTGEMPAPNPSGQIVEPDGSFSNSNDNPTAYDLDDAGASTAIGHSGTPNEGCDLTNDCSGSIDAQWEMGMGQASDFLWSEFTVNTPAGTKGWTLDFAFFSSEFPEFVGEVYNDMFIVWVETDEFVGNQCFVGEQPCTVTALDGAADAYSGTPDGLDFVGRAGTGLGTELDSAKSGQTTGWVELRGPATPGTPLRVAFILFDMFDPVFDTTVLVDDFRWDCEGCVPGYPVEDGGCGIEPG